MNIDTGKYHIASKLTLKTMKVLARLSHLQEMEEISEMPTMQMPITPPPFKLELGNQPTFRYESSLPAPLSPLYITRYRRNAPYVITLLTEAAYDHIHQCGRRTPEIMYLHAETLKLFQKEMQMLFGHMYTGGFHLLTPSGMRQEVHLCSEEDGMVLPEDLVICISTYR